MIVAAAISLTGENVEKGAPPIGYRIHHWKGSEKDVVGISMVIPTNLEPPERIHEVWAKHCVEEMKNLERFFLFFIGFGVW